MRRSAALVLFTEPFQFPPTLNLAEVLAARGWTVDVFGLRIPGVPTWSLRSEIRVYHLDRERSGLALRAQYAAFTAYCVAKGRANRYAGVVGYDMMGALPAYALARSAGAPFIYHIHDLAPAEVFAGIFYPTLKRAERGVARAATLVTLPQPERAALFRAEAGLSREPETVFNCPRLAWMPREGPAAAPGDFEQWRSRVGRVVLYQGGLAVHRGIDRLVESIPHWSFAGGLCLIGLSLERGVDALLRERARSLGVAERLYIHGPVSHAALPAYTARADVGVGVLLVGEDACAHPRFVNLKHLAGASNKIFEYMAAGLPIVSGRGAGFEALLQEPMHGLLCDGTDPRSIAAALNALFALDGMRETMARNNRLAFEHRFNYEAQVAPMLEAIGA